MEGKRGGREERGRQEAGEGERSDRLRERRKKGLNEGHKRDQFHTHKSCSAIRTFHV